NFCGVWRARVGEGISGLAGALPVRVFRKADTAGGRNLFEPCRDVDALAEHVASFNDDVSDVDADTEFDTAVARDAGIALCHSALHRYGAGDCFHDRRERKQQAVARGLDDLSLMSSNERIDQV